MAEKKKVEQPEWFPPSGDGFNAGLKVNNSLTSSKVDFVPRSGKKVVWYICGPTVYDSSHMGHARNYVTFDIIRRILEDYFGYDVFAIMNITDVEDKIILRARRLHLFSKYKEKHSQLSPEVIADLTQAWEDHITSLEKKLKDVSEDKERKPQEREAEMSLLEEKLAEARTTSAKVQKGLQGKDVAVDHLLDLSVEALSVLVDSREGHTISEQKIFNDFSSTYEKEFMEDMRLLGVRVPDVMTRVTEYIPEVLFVSFSPKIIEYVERIIKNGFGYESNGSVYFDTQSFEKKHPYGKLDPSAIGNTKLLEEGEGALSKGQSDKRNPKDFALWKKSKPGEPFWDSPWGQGRPGKTPRHIDWLGWHIECSAMASAVGGTPLDIHGGGEDLKFPHHDNELAQSEAYYDCRQWVNYFLHSGHLHISGLKMSKSLKNFITIREALKDYSSRQLRLLFLLKPWDRIMNYVVDTMSEVKTKEKTFVEFFQKVNNILRDTSSDLAGPQKWTEAEKALLSKLDVSRSKVDEFLKDNFNTSDAIHELLDLIRETNIYTSKTESPRSLVIRKVASFVTFILRVFGVAEEAEIGFGGQKSQGQSVEETLAPYINVFLDYRQNVRSTAIAKGDPNEFLRLSDKLRDEDLVQVGLRLRDADKSKRSMWNLVDPAELAKEKELEELDTLNASKKKLEQRLTKLVAEITKMESAATDPSEMFKDYLEFDDKGVPTKDKEGKEVPKSAKKKLEKILHQQEKNHKVYLERTEKDPHFLEALNKDRGDLTKEVEQILSRLEELGQPITSKNSKKK